MLEDHSEWLHADGDRPCKLLLRLLAVLWLEVQIACFSLLLMPSQIWRAGLVLLILEEAPAENDKHRSPSCGVSFGSRTYNSPMLASLSDDGATDVIVDLMEEEAGTEVARFTSKSDDYKEMVRACRLLFVIIVASQCVWQLLLRLAYVASTGVAFGAAYQSAALVETTASGRFEFSSDVFSPWSPSFFYLSTALDLGALCGALWLLVTENSVRSVLSSPSNAREPLAAQANKLARRRPPVDPRMLFDALCEALDAGITPSALKEASKSLFASRVASANALKNEGFSAEMCLAAGALPIELREAGFTAAELVKAFKAKEAADSKSATVYSAGAYELRRAGFSLLEVRSTGSFSIGELRDAGFKASEMKGISVSHLREMGYSASDIVETGGFSERLGEFRRAGFSAGEMRTAGYDAIKLLTAGYAASELKTAGFGAAELQEAGACEEVMVSLFNIFELKAGGFPARSLRGFHSKFGLNDLREAGYSMSDLEDAGYSTAELRAVEHSEQRQLYSREELIEAIIELKNAGCSASELRELGFSCAELKSGEYSLAELKAAGFSSQSLFKDAGYSLDKLRIAGFSATELRESGAQLAELHAAGFSALQLKQAGHSLEEIARRATAAQLRVANYSAIELREVGFSLAQLKAAGYPTEDLSQAGYGLSELHGAGYKAQELVEAGFSGAEVESLTGSKAPVVSSPLRKSRAELNALSGKSTQELLDAGLSMLELKTAGVTAVQLKELGYGVGQLKHGFSSMQLREAGFTAIEQKKGGVPPSRFKKAGYSEAEIKEAIVAPRFQSSSPERRDSKEQLPFPRFELKINQDSPTA